MRKKTTKTDPEKAHNCEEHATQLGMTNLEFHEKLATDDAFAGEVVHYIIGVSDKEWNEMPEELKRTLILPMKAHGQFKSARLRHPTLTAILDFIFEADETLRPFAAGIGYVSMVIMVSWWIKWLVSAIN